MGNCRKRSRYLRNKRLSAPLSKELRQKHGVKSIPVRKGDDVTVMRGEYEGRDGKVTRVEPKKLRLYIQGVTREKADGTTFPVPIHTSKIMIKKLSFGDKWRKAILDRKTQTSAKIGSKTDTNSKKKSKKKREE